MNCNFEASNLDFGRRHLVFLEPEVTIFGRNGGTGQLLANISLEVQVAGFSLLFPSVTSLCAKLS